MSRIGKLPIKVPKEVKLEVLDSEVQVSGPRGSMSKGVPSQIGLEIKEDEVKLVLKKKGRTAKMLYGTFRSLLSNMIVGVERGWSKELEIVGTGYRAELLGSTLTISLGFSHPIKVEAPKGISFEVGKNEIKVLGVDKELVGLVAAKIRKLRPPDPYKGKGIKYKDEYVRRKAGKAAQKQGMTTA